ncbi:MAG: ABC transporter permease subunit [Alphaproteobacteria bacterium]|nr:ABC transporter permease subunit [Alphaproteobacteria bacterium]
MTTAVDDDALAPAVAGRIDPVLGVWLAVVGFGLVCVLLRETAPWIAAFPDAWVLPVAAWTNAVMDVVVAHTDFLFRAVASALEWPMVALRDLLVWAPWPATIAVFAAVAHRAGGWKLALFTLVTLMYMVVVGYWEESMNTLALVGVSVPLSVAIGFAMGVLAFRSARAKRVVMPLLDLMQTVPAFAYLIPILLLFGFGPVVGLIASAIYAAPPMVRNTIVGLERVPPAVLESAAMNGCTKRQRFWWVEVPSALPQIMVGVNQTTMAALSMVIIAAIIGGFGDIGWEVLSTMRKAQFGQSLLSGVVIALMAMIMDRISAGFADRSRNADRTEDAPGAPFYRRRRHLLAAAAGFVLGVALGQVAPLFQDWPKALVVYPAEPLNQMVEYILVEWSAQIDAVKNAVLFFLMLPLRIGLEKAVSPFTFGFELTAPMIAGYWIAAALGAAALAWRGRVYGAIWLIVGAAVLYFGVSGLPWPAFMAAVVALAWTAGGLRTAGFALGALLFILLTGAWEPMTRSVYLCGLAVAICFALGGALGVWAAHNDRVSATLRPINDTLQTMPQFVILIPVLMLFQVGEFSALIAVVLYAIVPPIRYVEHGLRNVSPEAVEAARQMGCTPAQILFTVKLPLALPVIMLGLNQTIMYGLAMLVIAALVGTKGLGQQVFLALGKADMGMGLVAGLSIALVAMVADRILQAWSRRRSAALGLDAGDAA